jgi:hypothetical protein
VPSVSGDDGQPFVVHAFRLRVSEVRRGRSTGAPTAAQAARFDAIREAGCLVAQILGIGWLPAEIHHMTTGGKHGQKRLGHDASIGLNCWSHRGVPLDGWTPAMCAEVLGPSYAHQPRLFRAVYGNDVELLARQNAILGDEAVS